MDGKAGRLTTPTKAVGGAVLYLLHPALNTSRGSAFKFDAHIWGTHGQALYWAK